MARRSLNGYLRIGIVLSVVWAICFPLWLRNEDIKNRNFYAELGVSGVPLSDWNFLLLADAALLALGWTVCLSVYFIGRWIFRGFTNEVKE